MIIISFYEDTYSILTGTWNLKKLLNVVPVINGIHRINPICKNKIHKTRLDEVQTIHSSQYGKKVPRQKFSAFCLKMKENHCKQDSIVTSVA